MSTTTTTDRSRTDTAQGADSLDEDRRAFGEATLAEFADSWKRPSDFAERAQLVDVTPERCEKRLIRETTAIESRETVQIPPSEYESLAETRTRFDDRYELAREEFPDATVEYVCPADCVDTCEACDGAGQTACPNCTTGETRCGTCGGDGMETCSTCSGWSTAGPKGRIACPDCTGYGTTGSGETERTCASCGGDGHVMCNGCSGGGEHRCTTCGGGGIVTCGTCDGSTRIVCSTCTGEKKLVTADIGEVVFASTSTEEGVSETGVPERFITRPTGTKFKTDDEWTDVTELETETVVRREVERRHVDATRIDYSYDGQEYSVYDVEGSIRADTYPQSGARNVVPYIVAVVLLAAVSYGAYQYVV